jgi:hypothetical protein
VYVRERKVESGEQGHPVCSNGIVQHLGWIQEGKVGKSEGITSLEEEYDCDGGIDARLVFCLAAIY